MRLLESIAILAALGAPGEAMLLPSGYVHTVRPASLLPPRSPQAPAGDWQPEIEKRSAALDRLRKTSGPNEAGPGTLVTSDALQNDINTESLLGHANILQAIAYQTTRRNRVFGSPGHNFTALYLFEHLSRLSDYYDVEYQPFVETYSEGDTTFSTNGEERDSGLMTYSPNGHVVAPVVAVPKVGCNEDDYPVSVVGSIALISRGSCDFGLKAAYAGAAGAVGAVIYNNVNGSLAGTLGAPNRTEGVYPPTLGISQADGQAILAQLASTEVIGNLNVSGIVEDRVTMNVIAQTKAGDPDNVIFVGAHADSVAAGPGINDNGSGSIGILEVALQLAKYEVNNAVRFAWWSAEEFGLLGAKHYVDQSTPAELDKIRLYLNFDMIASPNYFLGIYDGDGSAFNRSGPPGSAEAEALFEGFFADNDLPSQPTEFDGRSDYGPFLSAGVAAGGLFTGAEGIKTEAEAALYGGEAGVAYDVNYHLAGDTLDNLNLDVFLINTRAIAHAVATYARSFSSFPDRNSSGRVVRRNHRAVSKTATRLCRG